MSNFDDLYAISKRLKNYKGVYLHIGNIFSMVPQLENDEDENACSHILQSNFKFKDFGVNEPLMINGVELYQFVNDFFSKNETIRKAKKIKPKDIQYEITVEPHRNMYRIYLDVNGELPGAISSHFNLLPLSKKNLSHATILEAYQNYYSYLTDDNFLILDIDVNELDELQTGTLIYLPVDYHGVEVAVPIAPSMIGVKKPNKMEISLRATTLESIYQYRIETEKDNIIESHVAYIGNF